MKIIDDLTICENNVEVSGEHYASVLAKSYVYIPTMATKVILSFQGCLESTEWTRGKNAEIIKKRHLNPSPGFTLISLYSVVNEFEILRLLSQHNMSPKPKQLVYFNEVKSKLFTDDWYVDHKGMFGYEIEDATKLEPGNFNPNEFQTNFINTRLIDMNQQSIDDLEKRIVNGYLVDIRCDVDRMMQRRKVLDIDTLLRLTHNKGV